MVAFSTLTTQFFTNSPSWVDLLNTASDIVISSASIVANVVCCTSCLSKQAVQKIGMKTGIRPGVEGGGRNRLIGPGQRSGALCAHGRSLGGLFHG